MNGLLPIMGKGDHDDWASEPFAGASYHHEEPEEEQETTGGLLTGNAPSQIQHFANSYGLIKKLDLLQNPATWLWGVTKPSNILDTTIYEIGAIENETAHNWHQPKTPYLADVHQGIKYC